MKFNWRVGGQRGERERPLREAEEIERVCGHWKRGTRERERGHREI